MNDKISIIVPVYNIAGCIEDTVASIHNQTYKNIEIVLVDNGSTDGSSEIIDKIALSDDRIKVLHKTLFHSLLHDELMDLSIKNTVDLLMNYYLFRESNKSIYYDICPYHYMLRENSADISKPNKHKQNDPIRVYKRLLEDGVNGASRRKRKAVEEMLLAL